MVRKVLLGVYLFTWLLVIASALYACQTFFLQ